MWSISMLISHESISQFQDNIGMFSFDVVETAVSEW